jgi:uncharacterized protein (TIGR02266 family)
MAENSSSDKRDAERVTINREFDSFDAFIQEYVTNISKTGVFIKTDKPLPIGTRVNLHFSVIMGEIETLQGVGEVVRIEQPGMGVAFRELSPDSEALVDRLMKERGRR